LSSPDDRARLDRPAAAARDLGPSAFGERVFEEPWQAQAFAMAVELSRRGLFTWIEWTDRLAREIAEHPEETYYRQWLAALEDLLEHKGLIGRDERLARLDAWDRAARATPHGQPITLDVQGSS
jgi:nitrile hydratase accessory protein